MTSIKRSKSDPKFMLAYERGMLRSAFVSLFWSVIQERKKQGSFTLKSLAKAISANKSEVSRWFRGDPNWTVNTIASIAHALNVDLEIKAVDRTSGIVFTPAGVEMSPPKVSVQSSSGKSITETASNERSFSVKGAAKPVTTSAAA